LPLTELYSIAGQTLAPDDQTLTFVAVDRYGNASKPGDVEFVIDETAPAIPTTPTLLDGDGNVTSTRTVADPRVVIRSIGETGSIVRLYRDGREVGLGIAQSPVDFPLNLGSLGDGTFSFTATAEDRTGNRSATSSSLSITIDTTAPLIESLRLDPASDTGTLGDQTTDSDFISLIGKTEPGAVVSVAGSLQTTVADAAGDFRLDGVPLRFGPNRLTVTAADALGNQRPRSINVFRPRLESNSPTIAFTLADDTGRYQTDAVTASPSLSGALNDESNVTGLFLTVASTSAEQSTQQTTGPLDVSAAITGDTFYLSAAAIEHAIGTGLDDGNVTFTLVAVDQYDNASRAESISFVLDRTAPDVPPELRLSADSDHGRDWTDRITHATSLVVSLDVPELANVAFFVDGNPHAEFLLPQGAGEVTLAGIAEGNHVITALVTDVAGNVSAVGAALDVSIDTTPPNSVVADLQLPPLNSDSGVLSGSTDAYATVRIYRGLDSQTAIAETIAASDGGFQIDAIRIADGVNRFRVVAEDIAGNAIETNVSARYDAPDLSAPQIKLALERDTGVSDTDRLTNDPTVSGMVDDASQIASFQIDAIRFADGVNRFRVVAEDIAGNAIETNVSARY
ncbi:Ig-like domain-containing protein, partial [Stieleria sp.]|uniref:Ig-like domain-containing protein n=1 Tax=Stieleria sp. TaxID=2795976 RepID=UPI003566792B